MFRKLENVHIRWRNLNFDHHVFGAISSIVTELLHGNDQIPYVVVSRQNLGGYKTFA